MVPAYYESAYRDFDRLLRDACEASGLATINQAYTMVEGVLQTFRRRLELREAVLFADALPLLTRALFVSDWDPDEPPRPFGDRATQTAEAQGLRGGHNFAPNSCIRDVAIAVRRNVREPEFDAVLAKLPVGAAEFWRVADAA
jgi:uncharacterized protein (DUF2267 family)